MRPVVYFNGSCPLCSREIRHYQQLTGSDALLWCDLAEQPDALAGAGVSPEAARRRLHARLPDGRLVDGLDSFLLIWDRLPRYRFLARLGRTAPGRWIARGLYDRMAVPLLAWINRRPGRG